MKYLLPLLLALIPGLAQAVECREESFRGDSYTICEVRPATDDLRLFLRDAEGAVFGHFAKLDAALAADGKRLSFAMNAGMYHDDRRPVGYYLEEGVEAQRVVSSAGPGNFGLLPNGILCLRPGRADVIETRAFVANPPACQSATQSGPMLVIDGALHPRFLPDSTSRFIRNGVGTTLDGSRAVFVISNNVVTFHAFGSFFKDHLGLPNALYLDGNVSRIRAPGLGRDDAGFTNLGPIIGVVTPAAE
ncbi:MAG: hypothetical protein HKN30_13655 [Sulfitobacter sp.]|nr:hypothetical protein [Sulfitobacter sp.]